MTDARFIYPPVDWFDSLERQRAACPPGPFHVRIVEEDDDCWRWQVVHGDGRLLSPQEEHAVAAFTVGCLDCWQQLAEAERARRRALAELDALRRETVREVPGSQARANADCRAVEVARIADDGANVAEGIRPDKTPCDASTPQETASSGEGPG